jgi:hypothetical protein
MSLLRCSALACAVMTVVVADSLSAKISSTHEQSPAVLAGRWSGEYSVREGRGGPLEVRVNIDSGAPSVRLIAGPQMDAVLDGVRISGDSLFWLEKSYPVTVRYALVLSSRRDSLIGTMRATIDGIERFDGTVQLARSSQTR